MKIKLLPPLLLFGMTASSTLIAQEPYIFEELDGDHNGAISMQEAKARAELVTNFSVIDRDGDGTLSVDEYSSYMNKGLPPEDMEIPEPGAAPVM
jgi:Ca2+-binding EF-hand superfamily protein